MRSTLEPKALAGAWQWPIREGVDTKVEPMQPTFMIMMGMILNQANDVTLLDMKKYGYWMLGGSVSCGLEKYRLRAKFDCDRVLEESCIQIQIS